MQRRPGLYKATIGNSPRCVQIHGEKLPEPDLYGWVFNYGTGDMAETTECSDVTWDRINISNGS